MTTTAVPETRFEARSVNQQAPGFSFVDLFAGVGGFHGALSGLGGKLQMAVEIDKRAQETYERNWGSLPERDVVEMARHRVHEIGPHAVLAGGFPCQPFSKSGRQLGMAESRGRLFDEILRILEVYKPPVVFLENVRNLAGPRQRHVWEHIVWSLRSAGYRVPSEPLVVSPHRLPRELGGAPQSRERVYILGTLVGRKRAYLETDIDPLDIHSLAPDWDPMSWRLDDFLEPEGVATRRYKFTEEESRWLDTWQDFLVRTRDVKLPGHPLWSSYWSSSANVTDDAPGWKREFERKNIVFYQQNRRAIDQWQGANPWLEQFPDSRRKFEWQAQDLERDIYKGLIHLRPSGIRVKKMTYAPALVAMAQTPLIGPRGRRMTPRETARLQNFPRDFGLDHQSDTASYKQLGNAVNIGTASRVFVEHVRRDLEDIQAHPLGARLVESVVDSPVFRLGAQQVLE